MIPSQRPPFPRRGHLLAIDSSARSPGLAHFVDGVLVESAHTIVPADLMVHYVPLERADIVADLVHTNALHMLGGASLDYLVVEAPQWDGRSGRVRPADLLLLAMTAGAVVSRFAATRAVVRAYEPSEWLPGNVSKKVHGKIPKDARTSPRGLLITRCAYTTELGLLPAQDDELDSVGLGFAALGRLVQPVAVRRPKKT